MIKSELFPSNLMDDSCSIMRFRYNVEFPCELAHKTSFVY
jgi:hypothetical protein